VKLFPVRACLCSYHEDNRRGPGSGLSLILFAPDPTCIMRHALVVTLRVWFRRWRVAGRRARVLIRVERTVSGPPCEALLKPAMQVLFRARWEDPAEASLGGADVVHYSPLPRTSGVARSATRGFGAGRVLFLSHTIVDGVGARCLALCRRGSELYAPRQ